MWCGFSKSFYMQNISESAGCVSMLKFSLKIVILKNQNSWNTFFLSVWEILNRWIQYGQVFLGGTLKYYAVFYLDFFLFSSWVVGRFIWVAIHKNIVLNRSIGKFKWVIKWNYHATCRWNGSGTTLILYCILDTL